MKRFVASILFLLLILPLTGCAASDNKIRSFLDEIDSAYSVNISEDGKTLKKCIKSENFVPLLNEHISQVVSEDNYDYAVQLIIRLKALGYEEKSVNQAFEQDILERIDRAFSEDNYDDAFNLLKSLSKAGYESAELKEKFSTRLNAYRKYVFESNDHLEMINYIERVKKYLDGNYYTSIIECFPYNEMKTYFADNGEKVVTSSGDGGYYDNIQDQFENEEYWYDPLASKKVSRGSVGTYQQIEEYTFFGDLMTHYSKRYWHDTSYSDPNNSAKTELYYKGQYIGNDNSVGVWQLVWGVSDPEMALATGMDNIECLYSLNADEDILLAAVGAANIYIIHNREMVTVAYE